MVIECVVYDIGYKMVTIPPPNIKCPHECIIDACISNNALKGVVMLGTDIILRF